jgi:hypothetical protein
MTTLSRRAFFTGLGAVLAAPVIVRASSIMPVRPIDPMVEFTALINSKMAELEERLKKDIFATVWGGDQFGNPFQEILAVNPPPDSGPAVRYQWRTISAIQIVA